MHGNESFAWRGICVTFRYMCMFRRGVKDMHNYRRSIILFGNASRSRLYLFSASHPLQNIARVKNNDWLRSEGCQGRLWRPTGAKVATRLHRPEDVDASVAKVVVGIGFVCVRPAVLALSHESGRGIELHRGGLENRLDAVNVASQTRTLRHYTDGWIVKTSWHFSSRRLLMRETAPPRCGLAMDVPEKRR